jgi:hypothetical protein
MGMQQELPCIPTWRCGNRIQKDNCDSLMVSLATKNSEIPNQIGSWSSSHLLRCSRVSSDSVGCPPSALMEWCWRTRVNFEANWRVLSYGYNPIGTFGGTCLLRLQGLRVSRIRNSRLLWPPLWSSGQSSWLQIQRSRVRFPTLPDFLRNSGSGTGSTHSREDNWGATWKESSGSGLENWN